MIMASRRFDALWRILRAGACALLLAAGLAVLPSGPVLADQKDPRLDELFDLLRKAPDPPTARSIEQLIWALWMQSGNAEVTRLMNQGVAAMSASDFRTALDAFDRVTRIAPDFAEGWNKLATVHYMIGDYRASLDEIEHVLELEPRHFGALSGLGLVQAELDHDEQALDAFERALVIDPQMEGARMNAEAIRRRLQEKAI
jgi:tetratricopeptide (TPR) repeat protein